MARPERGTPFAAYAIGSLLFFVNLQMAGAVESACSFNYGAAAGGAVSPLSRAVTQASHQLDPCGAGTPKEWGAVSSLIKKHGGDPNQATAIPVTFIPDGCHQVSCEAQFPIYRFEGTDQCAVAGPPPTGMAARFGGPNVTYHPCRMTLYADPNDAASGRIYKGFQDWVGNNELPKGKVETLSNGVIPSSGSCALNFSAGTPASSFWHGFFHVLDNVVGIVGAVAGVVALGALAVGAVITAPIWLPVVATVAAVTAVAAGVYFAGRAVADLSNRSAHEQSNSLANPQARGDWLQVAAGTLGVVAVGAGSLAAIPRLATAADALTATSKVAGQAGAVSGVGLLGNSAWDLKQNWSQLTPAERRSQLIQDGFWLSLTALSAGHGFLPGHGGEVVPTRPEATALPQVQEALARVGLPSDPASVQRFLSLKQGLPDSAVARLRAQILTDPRYAGPAGDVLRHYTAEALAGGMDTPEAKLTRLEMLMLAVPAETRPQLMAAVRADLATGSDQVRAWLAPGDVKVKRVIVGGGSQGSTIANALNRVGAGPDTLVVDAVSGDHNFGSIRSFRLNSESGLYDGPVGEKAPGRTENPLHGSPIQVEDLQPPTPDNPFPGAGNFGDASLLALEGARRGGANVLTQTRVVDALDLKGQGFPGRYRVIMEDNRPGLPPTRYQVYADTVVDATGLGHPWVPLQSAASRAYVEHEAQRVRTRGGFASVMYGEDFLRASTHATDRALVEFLAHCDGDICIVGGGDAGKTSAERIEEVARSLGISVHQLLGHRTIDWVGFKPQDLWARYQDLQELVDEGLCNPTGGRLVSIEPVPGTTRVRLTFRQSNGTVTSKEYGRVILAMGMRPAGPEFLKSVAAGYNPADLLPVYGHDPVYGDHSPLATRLPGQDIYFAGMASGLDRVPGVSFLQYFGWKNLLLVKQVLAEQATGGGGQGASVPPR